jgi:hypothetical protein
VGVVDVGWHRIGDATIRVEALASIPASEGS